MRNNFFYELMFFTKIQWQERIVTSSFLIGISLQSIVLAIHCYLYNGDNSSALFLAIRSGLFTCISILLFSAMSNISNEFKFETISYVISSGTPFYKLILLRSTANGFISLPAIIIPFVGYIMRDININSIILFYITGELLFTCVFCFVISFLINLWKQPILALPWFGYILFIIGLNLFNLPWVNKISMIFPSYWLLQEISHTSIWLFFITLFIWLSTVYWLNKRINQRLEKYLQDGRMRMS
ncbi:hypothetical protein [Xenorhabdus miraniensis]|uniref:ABC transporter permease n=1 Tax=Xenorhabdus miraniensis TaxID=351674 RepID=A0A2D0JWM1_9GAMM|nr:hypothetical protein [Xenorhabdus miraniensis]PHM50725.1 hypothetical protein Xmir_00127 [Xenorhabdus miraniensis]